MSQTNIRQNERASGGSPFLIKTKLFEYEAHRDLHV